MMSAMSSVLLLVSQHSGEHEYLSKTCCCWLYRQGSLTRKMAGLVHKPYINALFARISHVVVMTAEVQHGLLIESWINVVHCSLGAHVDHGCCRGAAQADWAAREQRLSLHVNKRLDGLGLDVV